ncbi:TilS substrate C-terminal domain-containing protein [Verticiella alkaliphila]|uniref:TilS substrate C-terminal domain-containing protein n=1 Tax=Verticiella alkaliphila TaxID=2779529 RepID=UPI003530328A
MCIRRRDPAWERPRLPLVWRGATLVYAAALGLDARIPQVPGGLQLRWQPDAPGATGGHRHDNSPRNAG